MKASKTTLEVEKPAFPQLIHEDTAAWEKEKMDIIRMANSYIPRIKQTYATLRMPVPLDQNLWVKICTMGTGVLIPILEEKKNLVADLLGIPSGITDKRIIQPVNEHFEMLKILLDSFFTGLLQKHGHDSVPMSEILIENDSISISQKGLELGLEKHRFYINNEYENTIKLALDEFAEAYSSLLNNLKKFGYNPFIESIYHTYLSNLYQEAEDMRLITDPSVPSFLSRFRIN